MNGFRDVSARLGSPAVQRAVHGTLLVFILTVPLYAGDRYMSVFIIWGINILLAASICLLSGFTGQFSMGQAAFYAAGAYGTGSLSAQFDWPLWASIPAGIVIAALAGLLVSLPAGRVNDFYLAVITLALMMIGVVVLQNWTDVTGGFTGLIGVQSTSLMNLTFFGHVITQLEYFYVVAAAVVLVLWLSSNLIRSPIGRAFVVVRESELAASTLGIRPGSVKKSAFVLSAGIAGLAGVLYAHSVGYLSPESFGIDATVAIIAMGVLGGLRTIRGAVLGSFVLTFGPDQLQAFDEFQLVIYGAVLLLSFLVLPRGLAGVLPGRQTFVRPALEARAADHPAPLRHELGRGEADRGGLQIEGVSKRFGGVRALEDVTLAIKPGEITGLMGPNGSGKSTLLNVISGIYRPTTGTVRYGPTQVSGLSEFKVARRGIARTFQHPVLVDEMTVLENVLLGSVDAMRIGWLRSMFATPLARARERQLIGEAQEVLTDLGLGELVDREVRDLPFGRRRMVELARALIARPTLLMLDEPAAGLAEHEMAGLANVIRRLRDNGTTVILVEHHMDFLMSLVDRCMVLDNGRVIFEGPPAETTRSAVVRDAYLGRADDSPRPDGCERKQAVTDA